MNLQLNIQNKKIFKIFGKNQISSNAINHFHVRRDEKKMKNISVLYFAEKRLRICKVNDFLFGVSQKTRNTKLDKLFLLLI